MSKWTWVTQEEIDSWGPGNKKCKSCNNILDLSSFHKTKQCLFGVSNKCKNCRKIDSKQRYSISSNEYLMFNTAKSRATKNKIPFSINISDIVIPDICPALGIPLVKVGSKMTDNSPTLDRIIPDLGYVKDNIIVISNRANRIKSNASANEIYMIYKWLEDICNKV